MSHYARIVQRLRVKSLSGASTFLPPETEIKKVRVEDGAFTFEALIEHGWCTVTTDEDLPAYTDRGRAQRTLLPSSTPTLKPGRPVRGVTVATRRLGVPLSAHQAAYVKMKADNIDESAAEYVRRLLIADGMPP